MSEPTSDLLREGPKQFLNHVMKRDEEREHDMRNLFRRELALVDGVLELQLQGFQTFVEDDTGATFSIPVQQLLTRLFNHQLAARKLLLMGYITEAASVLARALETSWLARYFDCYPDEIDKWWNKTSERGQLSPKQLRQGLKQAHKEGKTRIGRINDENTLYQELCEIGHPNFYGSIWHMYVRGESPPQLEFLLGGYGSSKRPESLKRVFQCLLNIQMLSLLTMADVSAGFLEKNAAWDAEACSLMKSLAEWINA